MKLTAKATHLPHTPRKLRLVAGSVKGQETQQALTSLEFSSKNAASPLKKLIKQAVANARNNLQLTQGNLFIKEITITPGRKLKRARFAGKGRYKRYIKRTSHLGLVLEQRLAQVAPSTAKTIKNTKVSKDTPKTQSAKSQAKKTNNNQKNK